MAAVLLRASASPLMVYAAARCYAFSEAAAIGLVLIAVALALGVLTRWAALVCAALAMAEAAVTRGDQAFLLGLLALNAAALALLGGGAYSVDALLFGRRVITMRE